MRIIEMSMKDVHRSLDTKRWQIVKVARTQSIAEHSFMVAMLVERLCHLLHLGNDDTLRAIRYALHHDLPEVYTGDLPTPLKSLGGGAVKEAISDFESVVELNDRPLMDDDPFITSIIKAADLIESVLFLRDNAMTDHGKRIKANIMDRIQSMVNDWSNAEYFDWPTSGEMASVVLILLDEVLDGGETTLDDILGSP